MVEEYELLKWMSSERPRFQWRTKKIQYLSKILSAVQSKTSQESHCSFIAAKECHKQHFLPDSLVVIAEVNIQLLKKTNHVCQDRCAVTEVQQSL